MKKKLMSIAILAAIAFLLLSCSSKNKTEYDIDEFGKIYEETQKLFDNESKYLTTDELYGNEGYQLYKKCSNKTGLPFNEEITLRGIKSQTSGGIQIISKDEKYEIYCYFPTSINNVGIFIPDGENIIVNGIFSKKDSGYGFLSDTAIISPEKINIEYKGNNVTDVISSIPNDDESVNEVIYGEVTELLTLDELKDKLSKHINFDDGFYHDKVARLDGVSGNMGTIYFTYHENIIGELSVGDKIAIQGDVRSFASLDTDNGYIALGGGIIESISSCYNFTAANK